MTAASAAIRNDVRVIGLIGFAHGTSHFFHLLLPPLFPWLMPEFGLSFTQAGAMMTVFFVVSALGQAASGFVVDRIGPRRVLLAGIACFILAGLLLSVANTYAMLLAVGALAGLGNSVFHPADFTVLNRKVSPARLGHAFSVHGLSGNIGWAIAPVYLTGIAAAAGWRAAALGAAALGEFAEGALLLFLFSLGHALEERALDRARAAVRALADLAPKVALVRRDGKEQELPVESLARRVTFTSSAPSPLTVLAKT